MGTGSARYLLLIVHWRSLALNATGTTMVCPTFGNIMAQMNRLTQPHLTQMETKNPTNGNISKGIKYWKGLNTIPIKTARSIDGNILNQLENWIALNLTEISTVKWTLLIDNNKNNYGISQTPALHFLFHVFYCLLFAQFNARGSCRVSKRTKLFPSGMFQLPRRGRPRQTHAGSQFNWRRFFGG